MTDQNTTPSQVTIDRIVDAASQSGIGLSADASGRAAHGTHEAVSYTHLTLPTKA